MTVAAGVTLAHEQRKHEGQHLKAGQPERRHRREGFGRAGDVAGAGRSLALPAKQHGCAAAVLPDQPATVDTGNGKFLRSTVKPGWFSQRQHGQPLTRPPASGVAGAGAGLAPVASGREVPGRRGPCLRLAGAWRVGGHTKRPTGAEQGP